MNKDVIYIDVEDDITAIISKVKASKEKIVALVPPKRIGVLQSAVNLRLLSRTAEQGNKRLVIITSNHALMSLAASASLPVARNLQSKPELAEVAALEVDDGDDIIDGNDLPIGEHAGLPENENDDSGAEAVPAAVAASRLAQPPKAGQIPAKPRRGRSGMNVPNFNTFRKKLLLGIGGGVVLIAFLVWAIAFAPRATIVIAAKTNDSPINTKVTAGDKLTTDLSTGTLKAVKAQKTDAKTIDFAATGTKNLGEKASGIVKFSQQSQSSTTVPAGTQLRTGEDLVFITDSSVTVPASTFGGGCFPTACPGSTTVSVTAAEGGAKYNAASGSLSGAPSPVSASFTDPTSGGTDKIAKVVTADDVQKAKQALVDDESKDVRSQLKSQLKNDKAINDSYRVDYNDVKSSPDVGAEATSGNATLSANVVYTMYGVSTDELGKYLDAYIKKQLSSSSNQRAYDNGARNATFQDVTNAKDGSQFTLIATAKLGPKLEESTIKKQSLGKKTGEIQENLQGIRGIEDVQVNYFPFWVTSVPGDPHKVNVQFKVND
jgi:hypothetical protein